MHWSELKAIWSHGDIHIRRPKNSKELVFYLTKYFNKNINDERFIGRRSFMYSKNLKRPIEIKGFVAEELANKIKIPRTTIQNHLRKAEIKILNVLLE